MLFNDIDPGKMRGTFLLKSDETLRELGNAASLPLPHSLSDLLTKETLDATQLLVALRDEEATGNGYWRVMLGALAYANDHALALDNLSNEFRSSVGKIVNLARKSLPGFFQNAEFIEFCASLAASIEARALDKQTVSHATENDAEHVHPSQRMGAVRHVASAGMQPTLQYLDDGVYATVRFSLTDDVGAFILDEEITAEDLIFIAHSALSAAKDSFLKANRVVKEGALRKIGASDDVSTRFTEIQTELDALTEILDDLPSASQS